MKFVIKATVISLRKFFCDAKAVSKEYLTLKLLSICFLRLIRLRFTCMFISFLFIYTNAHKKKKNPPVVIMTPTITGVMHKRKNYSLTHKKMRLISRLVFNSKF
jgi:hypothetical protein